MVRSLLLCVVLVAGCSSDQSKDECAGIGCDAGRADGGAWDVTTGDAPLSDLRAADAAAGDGPGSDGRSADGPPADGTLTDGPSAGDLGQPHDGSGPRDAGPAPDARYTDAQIQALCAAVTGLPCSDGDTTCDPVGTCILTSMYDGVCSCPCDPDDPDTAPDEDTCGDPAQLRCGLVYGFFGYCFRLCTPRLGANDCSAGVACKPGNGVEIDESWAGEHRSDLRSQPFQSLPRRRGVPTAGDQLPLHTRGQVRRGQRALRCARCR
jgi:hypothetical protein